MDTVELQRLRARLARVERRVRVVITAWIVSVSVVGLLGVSARQAESQPDTLRARALEIVDQDGNVRIYLNVYQDGTGEAVFNDRQGRGRMWLHVRPDGTPAVTLADSKGRGRIWIASFADETSGLLLSDVRGRGRVWLGAGTDASNLVMVNPGGQVQFKVP